MNTDDKYTGSDYDTREIQKRADRKAELYDEILNDESFLNDFLTSLGATDKVNVIQQGGWDIYEEFEKYQAKDKI